MNKDEFSELIDKGLSLNVINQKLKAKNSNIYIPENVMDANLIRKLYEICERANFEYSYKQTREILDALKYNVDIEKYITPKTQQSVIKEFKLCLMQNLDIEYIKDLSDVAVIREIRLAMLNNVDKYKVNFLKQYNTACFYREPSTLKLYRLAFELGLSLKEAKLYKKYEDRKQREELKKFICNNK